MTDTERAVLIEKMIGVAQIASTLHAHDAKSAALTVVKEQLELLKQ